MGTYDSYGETVTLLRITFFTTNITFKLKLCRTFIKIYFIKANKAKRRNFSSYITGCMIRSTGAETGRQSWGSGTEGLHWLENDQNSGLFSRQA